MQSSSRLLLVAAFLGLTFPRPAFAQKGEEIPAKVAPALEETTSIGGNERALELGHDGLRFYSEARYSEALAAFTQADELAHSPVFVLYRARAARQLGDLLLARRLLRECARETITPETPSTWKAAVADAVRELDALNEVIPLVRIVVKGGVTLPVQLELSDQSLTLEEPEATIELNPGLVRIVAQDAGGTRMVGTLFVVKGKRGVELELSFPLLSTLPSAPLSVEPSIEGGELHRAPSRPYRSGAHAAFLLGGASFLLGTASAIVAWRQANRVKENCIGTSCRPEDKELARSARNWANTATAAYVAGGVGVATGVGLLFWPTGVGVRGEF